MRFVITLIRKAWKKKHRLRYLEVFLPDKPPGRDWDSFPDLLHPALKTYYVKSLVRDLSESLEGGDVEIRIDINPGNNAVGEKDDMKENALHWAIWRKDDDIAERILSMSGSALDEGNIAGRTPLHLASGRGTLKSLQLLLAHGFDVDRRSYGETPLSEAVRRRDAAKVALLLTEGRATPDLHLDEDTPTALWVAASINDMTIVNSLLAYPAVNVDVQNIEQKTPLHVVIERHGDKGLEVVRALRTRAVASLGMKDNSGLTPLSLAEAQGYSQVVQEFRKP
ncbi:hypothetical protein M409DRAFT_31014 [Zasmidium cellare ATCC 36951]|uniref:Uncharacterized protein n=1 Tax=Zasmidium cellare ATCC 36951 TaxID=1080233 RepID=A0A6A6BY53_ZASCE|nr:uncharacterized protein M409DRAFT_31014 [Zasmidium cellare ATCC 36951]KAF2158482.1 hypothetical protein M409DRAFT_31014 [Zasmidium cellare ATCC 36951]